MNDNKWMLVGRIAICGLTIGLNISLIVRLTNRVLELERAQA